MRRVGGQHLSYLSEYDQQESLNLHLSAPHVTAFSVLHGKLVQRLLCYTHTDLWPSEADADWQYPLLVTLRAQELNI